MKIIGKGRSAEVYDYKDNKVLKLFYSTSNDKDIEYEYLITKNISDITRIVPKVYDVINVKGRTGIVYEKISGQTLSDVLSKNFKDVRKIMQEFAQTQKILSSINFGNFPNYTNQLTQKIVRSGLICTSEKEKILNYLKVINKNEICHGDFHPENVFVDQNDNFRVIDWANMFVGNKYIDMAKTYYLIKLGISINKKTKLGQLMEWLGRQYITRLYWEEVKKEKNINNYFLPCLFVAILIRYDENVEQEKKWIYNYVMKNKEQVFKNMGTRTEIH